MTPVSNTPKSPTGIWSVEVSYEAPDYEAAADAMRRIQAVLDELCIGVVVVSALAAVAPLVQFDEEGVAE